MGELPVRVLQNEKKGDTHMSVRFHQWVTIIIGIMLADACIAMIDFITGSKLNIGTLIVANIISLFILVFLFSRINAYAKRKDVKE